MAALFDSLGLKCEECGDSEESTTQGYNVVEQRHLCKTCAERIAHAILGDVSAGKVKRPCPEHNEKEADVYCKDCQVPMCHTCAVTTHVRHELADIMKFFAHKKQTIKRDLKKMSDLKSENLSFLETLTKCSEDIDEHFNTLENDLATTFATKVMNADKKRKSAIDVACEVAEEEIDKIIEKRESLIAYLNAQANNVKFDLEKKNNALSVELQDMKCRVQHRISKAREVTNFSLNMIDAEDSDAKSLLNYCDSKVVHYRLQKPDSTVVAMIPSTDKDLPALLTAMAKKVTLKKEDGEDNLGYLAGTKRSFEIEKTIKVPDDIEEPFLVCRVNQQTIAIRDEAGQGLYKVNVESGAINPLMVADKNRGIFDAAFLGNDHFAYSDYKHGQIYICSMDNEKVELQDLPNDGSRHAYLSVDGRGRLLAADHVHGVVYVIDAKTGAICRTINDIETRTIQSFDSLENGEIVIKSGHAEISWFYQSSGKIKRILPLEDWSGNINCHVGADNMIYVVYTDEQEQSSTGKDADTTMSVAFSRKVYEGVARRRKLVNDSCIFLRAEVLVTHRQRMVADYSTRPQKSLVGKLQISPGRPSKVEEKPNC
ncbi:uncharacterized protein [Diadema antillarum]|uniref:uncharacterized protein n=1 Tax=Diadema antillarum TaxID=105358 RepID=UPI003A85F650